MGNQTIEKVTRNALAVARVAGMTVADFRAPAPEGCTTQVAVDLDHEKFWSLIIDALERIGDQE